MKTSIKLILYGLLISVITHAQTVRVVNMIPNSLSNETNQDSEPNLAVNPNNPDSLVGTAFTPNPTGAVATAPVFMSIDGGNNWVLNNIVPSLNGSTGDITVGISRNNTLYSGILTGGGGLQMQILRKGNYGSATAMTSLLSRTNEDQPYVETITPLGGAQLNKDQVYVGHNDFNAASNRTASIEQSLDAQTAAAPANLTTERLEVRSPFGQDGPPIRTAVHPRGTVYAIFYMRTNSVGATRTGNVVVVRDDDWGQGATSYDNLLDPGDGLAGIRVATGISWTWNTGAAMGQERLGDRASIAVDPTDWQIVYIAYIDRAAAAGNNTTQLHVRRSVNGGVTWSADLLTINNIICPQLAVNISGDVGILYQQFTGVAPNEQWVTHFRQSANGGAAWNDIVLSQTPSNAPVFTFSPYLGDYAGLEVAGKDFFGIFSANNTPNNANFPNGVTYQRNADFTTQNLRNLANTGNVNVSIDPFFFEVQQIADNQDFYVRDWTDNTTSSDKGLEPSTHPFFYITSDVWNRRSNSAGGFNANDQPQSQNPQLSSLGNNFAFARVHRKGTGVAQTVNLHFLKSEFGTGSNYVNANTTADPTLAFAAGDQVKTLAAGYQWTLVATTSIHTCLAVEISTATDPVVTPTLIGRAPSWPDTDLSVLYDNNKAQRNMGVSTTGDGASIEGFITYYAILHNAALIKRDFILQYEPSETFLKHYKRPVFEFLSGENREVKVNDNEIVIPNMKPGENRWIGITVPVVASGQKELAWVNFTEIVDNIPVNGFTIAVKPGSNAEAALENYDLYASVMFRIGKLFDNSDAAEESKVVIDKFITAKAEPRVFLEYLKGRADVLQKMTKELVEKNGGQDPFKVIASLDVLFNSVEGGDLSQFVTAHSSYCHKMDAFLSLLDKKNGDIADVLQNIRWQADIYKTSKALGKVEGVKSLLDRSASFEKDFYARKVDTDDYPKFIEDNLAVLKATVVIAKANAIQLESEFNAITKSIGDPKRLQKAHYDYLLKIDSLRE